MRVVVYDLLRKSRLLSLALILGGLGPSAFSLYEGCVVKGVEIWAELQKVNKSGQYPYLVWLEFLGVGLIWLIVAETIMDSLKKSMSAEEKGQVKVGEDSNASAKESVTVIQKSGGGCGCIGTVILVVLVIIALKLFKLI